MATTYETNQQMAPTVLVALPNLLGVGGNHLRLTARPGGGGAAWISGF